MKLSAKLPHDDIGAELMRFENVRGQRYTEIFLIGGHAITGHLTGGVYNTVGLNSPTGTGDSCPRRCWTRSISMSSRSSTRSSARSRTVQGYGVWTGWRSWSVWSATSTG